MPGEYRTPTTSLGRFSFTTSTSDGFDLREHCAENDIKVADALSEAVGDYLVKVGKVESKSVKQETSTPEPIAEPIAEPIEDMMVALDYLYENRHSLPEKVFYALMKLTSFYRPRS
jgi:hypothetical protein